MYKLIKSNAEYAIKSRSKVIMEMAQSMYNEEKYKLTDEQQIELSELINTPVEKDTAVHVPVVELPACDLSDPECEVCSS